MDKSSIGGRESIAQMISRLGPPPEIVVQDWVEQLTATLAVDSEPCLSLTPENLTADRDNRLLWLDSAHGRPQRLAAPAASGNRAYYQQLSAPARQVIEAFSAAVSDSRSAAPPQDSPPAAPSGAAPPRVINLPAPIDSATTTEPSVTLPIAPPGARSLVAKWRHPSNLDRRRRLGFVAAVAMVAVVMGVLIVGPSGGRRSSQRAANEAPAPTPRLDVPLPNPTPTAPANATPTAVADDSVAELSTPRPKDVFSPDDSPTQLTELDEPSAAPAPLSELAADALWRPQDGSAEQPLPNAPDVAVRKIDADLPDAGEIPDADLPDSEIPDAGELPDAAEPPDADVRRVEGQSIALPDAQTPEAVVHLAAAPVTPLALEFPGRNPGLQLAAAGENRWAITADRGQAELQPLATIVRGDQVTEFRWSESAVGSPLWRQLSNARLRVDSNSGNPLLYLRPSMEIDPLPFVFTDLDVRTVWPLIYAPDPVASRLQIHFELPDEVEYAWIESPEQQATRRVRAVAQFMLESDESVMMRMRIDIQAGTRLSCRQRIAARLDDAMPWQSVTRSGLEQFADQLIGKQTRGQQLLEHLASVYSAADYQERKRLRPQRERLQHQLDAMAATTQRLSQLILLLQLLEGSAQLRLELSTVWPDAVQPLLSTAVPPAQP